MIHATSNPRSVALVGPQGSGKSTLFDALLAAAGAPQRHHAGGAGHGHETRLAQCRYMDEGWSLLDCPGSVEFVAEAEAAIAVVDLAVVVCEPDPARALTVVPVLRALAAAGTPYLVFVNRIDTLAGRVRDTLAALQAHAAARLVLRQVPIREGDTITGYIDVVSERAYRYHAGAPSELMRIPAELMDREHEALAGLVEVLADHDDALLTKIIEDIAPTTDEVYRLLHKDQVAGDVVSVLLGAAAHDHGVRRLWKALRHDAPGPEQAQAARGIAPAGEPLAQVFHTRHAGHAGRLSWARVWRGPLADGAAIGGHRLGGLFRAPGGELARAATVETGELVALARLDHVGTGDTLGTVAGAVAAPLPFPAPPAPVHSIAIATEDRRDDVRLSAALAKLTAEDPSLSVEHDADLGQTLLHGQGEVHLGAAVERLARAHGLKVVAAPARVAFRETIRHAVHQHTRLKRQTGGHGQFADVKLDIAPRPRGEGFMFVNRVVGGAVPKQYIPAVAEAAEEATRRGPLGHLVVDIAVTLVDGTFHSVDSSDMAFRAATRAAMAEGLARAQPVLLEPIDHVAIRVPDAFTAAAQRLLSLRHAQHLGYAAAAGWPGWDEIEALLPQEQLIGFITDLRSVSLGLGTYRRRFDHLAEPRGRVAEALAATR